MTGSRYGQTTRRAISTSAALSEPAEQTLVYCCGPEGLLSAVEQRCAQWPEGSLHIERFAAKAPTAEQAAGARECFQVVCQRSGVTVEVSGEGSILEALEDADIPIMSSCLEGICGTCEATVLEGTPDHRDSMLTEAERASGNKILTWVSRSRTREVGVGPMTRTTPRNAGMSAATSDELGDAPLGRRSARP